MIGYTTLGTNDLEKAREYYDALLGEIGGQRIIDNERMSIWADASGKGMVGLFTPYDEKTATIGNGSMIALAVDSAETVEKMHAKAIALGGTDEGEAGPRGAGGTIFSYVRDPEGHKLAFFARG